MADCWGESETCSCFLGMEEEDPAMVVNWVGLAFVIRAATIEKEEYDKEWLEKLAIRMQK